MTYIANKLLPNVSVENLSGLLVTLADAVGCSPKEKHINDMSVISNPGVWKVLWEVYNCGHMTM